MTRLFDRHVAVDWSASARPSTGANSVWIAVSDATVDGPVSVTNPTTRREAESRLVSLLSDRVPTLVAVDASFGYPQGTASRFRLTGSPAWAATWSFVAEHLADDDDNANNRFEVAASLNRRTPGEGPFWGCPAGRSVRGLGTRKPGAGPLAEFRIVEDILRSTGRRPASVWQLHGAGSVGGQTLTLLPILHRLVEAGTAEVWPFTTGLRSPRRRRSVVAETWPTVFDPDLANHPVRDAAQVLHVAGALSAADDAGRLAEWLTPEVTTAQRTAAESEEGWVLMPSTR